MKIEFVNHASFLVEHNGVTILTDPWLFGSAFLNGWDLLCETKFDFERFKDIDYIWFSHEHPDHFAPPVLAKIPKEVKANITVLFQHTEDKKVLDYCQKVGFKTQELPDHKKVDLGGGLEVMCGSVLFFDSWLCFFADGKKVLNVNDCIVDGEVKAKKIKKYTGEVDVLFTQFSYAAWKGGPEDTAMRKASAQNKLEIMTSQMKVFNPKYIIPFASYVYFSHEENKYLNDGVNKPMDAIKAIEAAKHIPIVMYPEQVWDLTENWDNSIAVEKYNKEFADVYNKPFRKAGATVEANALIEGSKKYIAKLKEHNNFFIIKMVKLSGILGFFKPFKIYVFDLDKTFEFNINKGLTEVPNGQHDVEMHSESLAFIFKFDFGYDTLTVNGRFIASMQGFSKMTKNFAIGPLNNTGRFVNFGLLFNMEVIGTFLLMMRNFILKMRKVAPNS